MAGHLPDDDPASQDSGAADAGAGLKRCLSPEQALAYVAREEGGPPAETVQAHLDQCARCRVVVAEAARAATAEDIASGAVLRTLAVGERIVGRYEIRRFIARGGMGEVYEAADTVLGESVALKTLVPTVLDDERAVARLFDEVKLARKVTHPNVCRILEFGLHRKAGAQEIAIPFLTMEFLAGETLAARLARTGALEEGEVRRLLRELVAALAAVHRAGIVHRDFKAENVFLVSDGRGGERAVVMDFGLARNVRGGLPGRSTGRSIAGTADYMAPEQMEGKPPTSAFDVYALGIVLFEVLTGRKPFSGESPLMAAVSRLKRPPPAPSTIAPNLSPAWDSIVGRCLERDPRRRFPRVEEILPALEAVLLHRPPRRRPWLWVAGGALGLAVAGGVLIARSRGPAARAPVAVRAVPRTAPVRAVAPPAPAPEPPAAPSAAAVAPAPPAPAAIAAAPVPRVAGPRVRPPRAQKAALPTGAARPPSHPVSDVLSPPPPPPAAPARQPDPLLPARTARPLTPTTW